MTLFFQKSRNPDVCFRWICPLYRAFLRELIHWRDTQLLNNAIKKLPVPLLSVKRFEVIMSGDAMRVFYESIGVQINYQC